MRCGEACLGPLLRGALHCGLRVGIVRRVTGEDEDSFAAHPDDPRGDEGPMRGWVPPDDRLWLHPSERAAGGSGSTRAGERPPVAPPGTDNFRWVIGGLAAFVMLALAATGIVVASTNEGGAAPGARMAFIKVPTTEVGLDAAAGTAHIDQMVGAARRSIVALLVTKPSGRSVGTGVVVEAGGFIVALRSAIAGAHRIMVLEPDGSRRQATVMGHDAATGIAVLHIDDDLPAADFSSDVPAVGSLAVAMSSEAGGSSRAVPLTRIYAGVVRSTGAVAGTWKGIGFVQTAVAAPLAASGLGSPLINRSGAIAGILDAVDGSGASRMADFLPADLVRGVVSQIISRGSVDHGSLEAGVVDGADPTAPTPNAPGAGAVVQSVASEGAAARAGLVQGDRIVAVAGHVVRSVAELATELYADPPGTELVVTVVRDGTKMRTTVVLGQG